MWRCAGLLGVLLLLGGCQTTHEDLIAKGYPPAFADGFDDGCVSGRQAAGSISGEFRKNVPRYLKDKQYAEGWTDGFRQCQAMLENKDRERLSQRTLGRTRARLAAAERSGRRAGLSLAIGRFQTSSETKCLRAWPKPHTRRTP